MDKPVIGFFAYPAAPPTVGEIVSGAIERLRRRSFQGEIEPWSEVDIAGRFIVEGILERIDSSDLVIADISRLNFNVTYEVGYAIGAQKRLLLVKHAGLTQVNKEIASLGIYDTLGYKEYNNAEDLEQIIRATVENSCTAVQHLTTALFLSKPVEPLLRSLEGDCGAWLAITQGGAPFPFIRATPQSPSGLKQRS